MEYVAGALICGVIIGGLVWFFAGISLWVWGVALVVIVVVLLILRDPRVRRNKQ